MIVTKKWLNEWIDLEDKSSEEICDTLNSIGLEVDSLKKIRIPKKVVVGYIKECQKHPDADKLSVCQVDIGSDTIQIVCGAKNVKKDQFVPVALVGCELGNNFKIKKAKLRGVESVGMICSSDEIGLPKLNDGILELDDSIGRLEIGKELSEYELINDDIIEIELTANRGDCLSIFGIARDLSGAYKREIKHFEEDKSDDNSLGIGRVLSLNSKGKNYSSLLYKMFKKVEMISPLLLRLRLAYVNKTFEDVFDLYKNYTNHSCGVIVKLYSFDRYQVNNKCDIRLEKDENNIEYIRILDQKSYIGFDEPKSLKPSSKDECIIFEVSYADPILLSKAKKYIKQDNDRTFYNSSRGSEPNLEFGAKFFTKLLSFYSNVVWYARCEIIDNRPELRVINIHIDQVNALIGTSVEKSKIVSILKNLGFKISVKDNSDLIVTIPLFRHDIANQQDVTEEIVRMIGIKNIISKPLSFIESNTYNKALENYRKKVYIRQKSASSGFFEITNYIFTDAKKIQELGFDGIDSDKELINPVTNELNTLRTTLILGLLESASRNVKYGKKSIRLFEIGTIFDKNRKESTRLSYIFSGETQRAALRNNGKPKIIDFFTFAQKISSIIGRFEIEKLDDEVKLFSPYESGKIIKDGKKIGYIGRIHIDIQDLFDLPKGYVCEIYFDDLKMDNKVIKPYSKYPFLERDFSFLIPKNMSYIDIKRIIKNIIPKEVINFYPIDIYESEVLGNEKSLTVRFVLQSYEKTLNDEEINTILEPIINGLVEKGIKLR